MATVPVSSFLSDLVIQQELFLIPCSYSFSKAEKSIQNCLCQYKSPESMKFHIGLEHLKCFDLSMNCFHPETEGKMQFTTSKKKWQKLKLPCCNIDKIILVEFCFIGIQELTYCSHCCHRYLRQKGKKGSIQMQLK